MRRAIPLILFALAATACKGGDSRVKVTRSTYDPQLGQVPENLSDQEPPRRIGDAYTVYGLWVATQNPNLQVDVEEAEITVRGYIANVSEVSASRGGVSVTPNVWIADAASRRGLYFPVTGYADSYTDLELAAQYDRCITACTSAHGDPNAEAASLPGRYSPVFGRCVADVQECRDLYETNPKYKYYEAAGRILKWYVRDQIFVSEKRRAIEEELRGTGNRICEAGPAQRRLMATILVGNVLNFDLNQFRRDVEQDLKEKYPRQRIDQIDPGIVQDVCNRMLAILDDTANVRKVMEAIRALRAGTDDGSALGSDRSLGSAFRAALALGGGEGASAVATDAKRVADDLLNDILIRYFYSAQDSNIDANKACVFDDLQNFTSQFALEPIDLITRRHAMLGPKPDVTWEQAMESGQQYDIRARFTPQSRRGFIGWTLDILPTMVCSERTNCPEPINPIFGNVYAFSFGGVQLSGAGAASP